MSECTQQKLEGLTRREFFKALGYAGARTAGLVAFNVAAAVVQDSVTGHSENRKRAQKEAAGNAATGKLEVPYFASYIYNAAVRLAAVEPAVSISGVVGGYLFGDFVGCLLLRNKPRKTNQIIGAASAAGGKVVDYFSTYAASKQMQDPRFVEYGLHNYVHEINIFHSLHPDGVELATRGVPIAAISAFAGWVFPFIGRGYLCATSGIVYNNLGVAGIVSKALVLGDYVKEMINRGQTQDEINSYLSQVGVNETMQKSALRQLHSPQNSNIFK